MPGLHAMQSMGSMLGNHAPDPNLSGMPT